VYKWQVGNRAVKNLRFSFKKFLGFSDFLKDLILMYEDRIQNYDQEIHEEYLIHDTPIAATSFIALCRL